METVQQVKQQFVDVWSKLSKMQKTVIGVAIPLALVGIVVFTVVMGRSDYNILFSNLDAQDAAVITDRLQQMNTPYRLTDNGTTIAVARPMDQVYEIRNSLTADGIPRRGVIGFESLEKLPFGTTDTQLKMWYHQALEGELSRTISRLEGVKHASVHITQAKSSVFVPQEQPAKAGVVVELTPGYRLDGGAVQGIVHLVANSVEGLVPEKVTVLDIRGNIISNLNGDLGGTIGNGATMAQLEIQKSFQQDLEYSVQTLLEQVFGAGNVQVRVNAALNFDLQEVEKRLFEPVIDESGIIRNIEELKESFTGEGGSGGVPGTDSNIPTYPTVDGGGETNYESHRRAINYEINEIKEKLVVSQGGVRRLTVAVVVNGDVDANKQTMIENTVAASIGLDPNRGDVVSVTGFEFDSSLSDFLRDSLEQPQPGISVWWKWAPVAIGVLLLIGFALFVRNRRKGTNFDFVVGEEVAVSTLHSEPILTAEELEKKHMREEIEKIAKQKPSDVAQILKTWLAEE